MTLTLTYPGVYLVETTNVPNTVVPATTNLTAFIGSYVMGPTDEALLISSWNEFQSTYGGLVLDSLATYAVWQFFLNGGIGAWIVRITPPDAAPASGILGPLQLFAKSAGAWSNGYVVEVDPFTAGKAPNAQTLANLIVYSGSGSGATVIESLANLPASDVATLAAVIDARSNYVSASVASTSPPSGGWASPPAGPIAFPPATPSATQSVALTGGSDGTWTAANFVSAVEAQVGMGTSTGSPPSPPPPVLLDAIAPQVFNIMCIPDAAWLPTDQQSGLYSAVLNYCETNEAFFVVDPPPPSLAMSASTTPSWATAATVDQVGTNPMALDSLISGPWGDMLLTAENYTGATYYPWLVIPDPANGQRPRFVPPSGTVAGLYAATDTSRGVWKAPAGTATALQGVTALADRTITDPVNGQLNIMGVNCLRTFPVYGNIVWGTRTLAGSDFADSPFKYVPVRRLTDFIEQSLMQSLRWAVFEPNGPTLWSSISLEVGSFMSQLFSEGAFSGATASAAYQVTCDATTTSETDMLNGVVNVLVGFQPVDPAEFVVLNISLNAAPAASS